MGYTLIKCYQGGKCLLWRRVILSAVLFMFGLLPVFVGPGNVASAAPAAKQTQARQSKAIILNQGGHGGRHGGGPGTPPHNGYNQGHAAGVQDGKGECANGDKVPTPLQSNHLIPGFDVGYNDGLQSGYHFSCNGYNQGHAAGVQDGKGECANGDKVPTPLQSSHLIPGFDAGYAAGLQSGYHVSCPSRTNGGYDQGHAAGVQDGKGECANGDKVPTPLQSSHLPGFDAGYAAGLQSGYHFSCP